MKILVACEFSNVVSDAFRTHGHTVVSCDLIENEVTGRQWHHLGDVREILNDSWDMMLSVSTMHAPSYQWRAMVQR